MVPKGRALFAWIGFNAKPVEVFADPRHVPQQQVIRMRILPRLHHLREIDEDDVAFPIQNVVGRQIAVNGVMVEHQLHVFHHPLEKRLGFVRFQIDFVQRGRCAIFIADELHQDGAAPLGDGFRHVSAGFVQFKLGAELGSDPHHEVEMLSVAGFFENGRALAPAFNLFALSIAQDAPCFVDGVVFEIAQHPFPVQLGGHQVKTGGRIGRAGIDIGLLTAFHQSGHVGDEGILVKGRDGGDDPVPFVVQRIQRGGVAGNPVLMTVVHFVYVGHDLGVTAVLLSLAVFLFLFVLADCRRRAAWALIRIFVICIKIVKIVFTHFLIQPLAVSY